VGILFDDSSALQQEAKVKKGGHRHKNWVFRHQKFVKKPEEKGKKMPCSLYM
jgi:hypothetical protein